MGIYASDPAWADVTPLPTDEGGAHPLAAIAYSDEYGETMSYLRAIMAAGELSARALALTAHLIDLNPAHYTVWLYRARCLFALHADLAAERTWLNGIALANQKNYQIWHHRQLLVDRLGTHDGEREFIAEMLARDAKNYHVWTYRQWLVLRFGLWDDGELTFTEAMLREDVRNNSAWNHRWYIVNGREAAANSSNSSSSGGGGGNSGGIRDDAAIRQREIAFAAAALAKSPHNPSPWSYLAGIARKSGMPLAELKGLAVQYADLSRPDGVRSSHALDLLAKILAEESGGKEQAAQALDLLATTYDPIRKNYWDYRKGLLESGSAAVA